MFREMIRKTKQLPECEVIDILRNQKRGVLSIQGDDGYPYGMPMNHFYNEDDGCIYFHQGNVGYRLEKLREDDHVSFCTYDEGVVLPGDWALTVKSVIVFGRIEIIEDPETMADITRKLSYKFTQDDSYIDEEIERSLKRTVVLKLVPEYMSGKIVNEK